MPHGQGQSSAIKYGMSFCRAALTLGTVISDRLTMKGEQNFYRNILLIHFQGKAQCKDERI